MRASLHKRVARSMVATALVIAGLRALAACAMTPDLEFVSEASTLEFGDATSDGIMVDSSGRDADDADAAAADVRPRNTCPDAAPPNVDQCCGRVRCVGNGCNDTRCDDCKVCAVSSVCCIKRIDAASDCVATIAACK